MPTYVFRCAQGCPKFTEQHSMTAIPDSADCPLCGCAASRIPAAPMVGIGGTAAVRLHDRTRASADDPDVVASVPPAQRRKVSVTTNPLHRTLPRP
ncbi:FmdB family zinc ribbon protein [Mycobacterium sp. Lab-001]|uniref:FmdB family zinc ribbon protein n=1 Tax=Mycobacterium sp. Lab-001 TaxID=3410136 RepID=UPI003D16AB74